MALEWACAETCGWLPLHGNQTFVCCVEYCEYPPSLGAFSLIDVSCASYPCWQHGRVVVAAGGREHRKYGRGPRPGGCAEAGQLRLGAGPARLRPPPNVAKLWRVEKVGEFANESDNALQNNVNPCPLLSLAVPDALGMPRRAWTRSTAVTGRASRWWTWTPPVLRSWVGLAPAAGLAPVAEPRRASGPEPNPSAVAVLAAGVPSRHQLTI